MALMQTSLQPPPQVDEGLRKFFLTMYNHTAGGLGFSALVAYLVYSSGAINFLLSGLTMWLVFLAPLGMILWYSFKGQDWEIGTLTNFYYAFTGVMGLSLSSIFAVYSATSIVEAFLTTSLTFGFASAYGYMTKRDLSGWGSMARQGRWLQPAGANRCRVAYRLCGRSCNGDGPSDATSAGDVR